MNRIFSLETSFIKTARTGQRFFSILLCVLVGIFMYSTPIAEAQSTKSLYASAKAGDTDAMRRLGLRLIKGIGVKARDIPNGAKWLKKASDYGDAAATYQVGRLYEQGIYYSKSKTQAIKYYKLAAKQGEEKAISRLDKISPDWRTDSDYTPAIADTTDEYSSDEEEEENNGNPESFFNPSLVTQKSEEEANTKAPKPSSETMNFPGSDQAITAIVKQITAAATKQGVQSIAIVSFQSNGGQSNSLTKHIRSLILDEFTNCADDASPEIYDREDSKAIATESGFSMNGEQLTASHAIMVGEIFSAPGDSVGYISYRVFRATDTAILDAGFAIVKWNQIEMGAINGSTSTPKNHSLPYIEEAELEKISGGLKKLNNTGVALGQNGAQSADNTLQKRIAYAQLIPAILKAGIRLYEREFFILAARETSLSNQEAMPGHAKAIGQLKDTLSSPGTHQYKLQFSAIPGGKLLLTKNIAQHSNGSTATKQGHNGENDFNDFFEQIEAENRNVPLVYEYEVIISDEYVAPEKLEGQNLFLFWGHNTINTETHPAKTKLKEKAIEIARAYINNKKRAAQLIAAEAMYGFYKDGCVYAGPMSLCCAEAYKNLVHVDDNYARTLSDSYFPSMEEWMKSPTKGTHTYRDVTLKYDTSIEWKDGLPWKVKARIDLTPSKSVLIKRTNEQ